MASDVEYTHTNRQFFSRDKIQHGKEARAEQNSTEQITCDILLYINSFVCVYFVCRTWCVHN